MTLQEKATLAQDNDFRSKIQIAVLRSARFILANEAKEFIVRKFAEYVTKNIGGGWLNNFVHEVLGDDTITPESTDANLQYVVDANFDKLAKLHYSNI